MNFKSLEELQLEIAKRKKKIQKQKDKMVWKPLGKNFLELGSLLLLEREYKALTGQIEVEYDVKQRYSFGNKK